MRDEWLARQLLPPRRKLSVAEVVRDAGWIHTAGGTGVDLSLHARTSQRGLDDVFELPAVRDSMMLVYRDDVSLALAAGRRVFFDRLRKVEADTREIDRTAGRIAQLLGEETMSIDQIRAEVPSRSLGEAGRQLGLTSTLVVALRVAQLNGLIVRAGENRYRRAPFEIREIENIDRELAKRFVEWASPTNADEFSAWAGISKRAAKSALDGLNVAPPAPAAPAAQSIFFLPFRDNYTWFHRLEPTHHHTIVVDREVAGWFEFDGERLVWRMKSGKRPLDVARVAEEVETFIRGELGDLRHYAADNEKNRAARLAFVRGGGHL
jgi:DNA glycosylase AlkZ-like